MHFYTCSPSTVRNVTTGSYRRSFANHYMSAESYLPWSNDGRLPHTDDNRDIIMVAGADPYAFKPIENLTKPFVRATSRQAGAVYNEVVA